MSRRRIGSIRCVRDGVYRVELTRGTDPWTGKRAYMSENVYGSERDAEIALAAMVVRVGEQPTASNVTVREYVERIYLPWVEAGQVRRETANGYRTKLTNHVLPRFGDTRLGDLDPFSLDKWRDDMLSKMSERSALNVMVVFGTALNQAVTWRLMPHNPLRAVKRPMPEERDVVTLSASEARAYVSAFTGHPIAPAVVLAVATGFRPCEVAGLTWDDIDFHEGTVAVRRGLHERKSETWFEPPKSKRSRRTVELSAWAVEALRPLRGIGPLVPDGDGHMKPTKLQREYRRHVKASKLRYVPMRDLRHTHGTLMIEAGVPLAVVSRRLGHSTSAITDKFYVRPHRSADRAAVDAFDAMLDGAKRGDNSSKRHRATHR